MLKQGTYLLQTFLGIPNLWLTPELEHAKGILEDLLEQFSPQ